MLRIALILVALAGPAYATPDYILPSLFDVHSVAEDDVLNIRAEPDASSEIVGTLASNATRIEVVEEVIIGKSAWLRVNAGERSGWVSGRFMNPRYDVWKSDTVPEGFHCLGTEPFWSLKPEGGDLVLTRPDAEPEQYRVKTIFGGEVSHYPKLAIAAEEMTVAASFQSCSDGMSDRHFGMAVQLIMNGAEPQYLSGCCSVQP